MASSRRVTGSNLKIARVAVDAPEELKALAGIERLPFEDCRLSFVIANAPPSVPNALRRVMTDEMKSCCLAIRGFISADGSTDPMMIDQFVRGRLMMIPLRPRLPPEIAQKVTFELDVVNGTASEMVVYSGHLRVKAGKLAEPLFNPTFELAVVQPGRTIKIDEIYISEGYGRDHAAYQIGSLGRSVAQDLEEYPPQETHGPESAHRDESGYKASTLVAQPRVHLVEIMIPAAPDDPSVVKAIPVDACVHIKERLGQVISTLERWVDIEVGAGKAEGKGRHAPTRAGQSFTVVELGGGKTEGTLRVKGETHTLGALLEESVCEIAPDVLFVAYDCPAHEGEMRLVVRHHEDVKALITNAARYALEQIDTIQRWLAGAKPEYVRVTAQELLAS